MRRGGERDMALAAQQPRCNVEPDPASAGNVDFGPGVQIGEIDARAHRAFKRIDVGLQLDQITGHEARGQSEMSCNLHQQPGGVAARAAGQTQCLLRRLHAGLHADQILHLMLQARVEIGDEIDRSHFLRRQGGDEGFDRGPHRLRREIGREIGAQIVGILERKFLGIRLDEEIEGIEHRHVDGEIDLDAEFGSRLWEDEARKPVTERVLLPVDEMLVRLHLQRVAEDLAAAVRRGPEPDDLRPQGDRVVVFVGRKVM